MAEKQQKRKRTEQHKVKKKGYDHERAKTRVNIGVAFRWWRELRELKSLKTDAEVAVFLLDSYEKDTKMSTPYKATTSRQATTELPPPPVSSIGSQCLSERLREDFNIEGVDELQESTLSAIEQLDASMSSLEPNEGMINVDAFNDITNAIIDWEDETWYPDVETDDSSIFEEDVSG